MGNALKIRIGQILVDSGVVNDEQIQQALEVQKGEPVDDRRKIGDILVEDLGVDRDLVYSEIAKVYGFKKFELDGKVIDEEQEKFVEEMLDKLDKEDKEALIKKRILPFKVDENNPEVLIVLAADPTDKNIHEYVLQFGFNRYEIFYTKLKEIDNLISEIAPLKNEFLQILDEMSDVEEVELEDDDKIDEDAIDAEINQSKLTNLIEGCLIEAVRTGASDIHIVPRSGNRTEFMFRVDGKLSTWHMQEKTFPEAVSAVVKDRSQNVDRFEREAPQDGFIQRKIDDYLVRYRVSIMPIVGTEYTKKLESIVIRVLDDRKVITDLGKLGLQTQAKNDFIKAVSKPAGIVILTGPTGSGKSTTLVAALHHVVDPTLNVLTVEDPVEYIIPAVRQLKIGHKMDFDQAMRSILRHDPDIVMVGEIRDLKTAEIAIKLANTGHLTFSSLHTNDAPSAVSRLYKMGVEPFLIAYAINIVVAQRLIRTLHDKCKKRIDKINRNIPKSLGFTDEDIDNTVFYEAVGCKECNGGYKGRAAIHEALYFSREIREIIVNAAGTVDEEAIRKAAVKGGMLSLRMSGNERIKAGISTCEEVAHATSEE